jgi:hypothetical protein
MTENERPLIEVARETVRASIVRDCEEMPNRAACYIAGYDDGIESVAAANNAGFVDTLTLANQRIAELEAFIAAQDAHDHYAERDEVKSLREKVAELEARNKWLSDEVTKMHKLYGDLAASRAALGVVVDDAMVRRAADSFATFPHSEYLGIWREVLTAALTSATIVPLASDKVFRWVDAEAGRAYCSRESAAEHGVASPVPVHRGIAEVRDGE